MAARTALLPYLAILLLCLAGQAVTDHTATRAPARPEAYRRLFEEVPTAAPVSENEASDVKEALSSAGGSSGPYTDWVVACAPGRRRCPSLFLASWGYQCTTMDGQACCLQSNGKFCTRLDSWQSAAAPASWRGRDNTTAAGQSGAAEEWRQGRSGGSASEEEEQGWEGGSGEDSGEDSGKPWRKATATYFNSYPPCCTNEGADQTECDEFSGCEWAGQFAGVSGKKSPSWVQEQNIVALFEAGRSKEWSERWKGKMLRLKNPRTGGTLEVQVLDTCDDGDCEGCCTRNARRNGGFLLDLEEATAERFWEGDVQGMAAIERQEV